MAKNNSTKKKKTGSQTLAVRIMCVILGLLMLSGAAAMVISILSQG